MKLRTAFDQKNNIRNVCVVGDVRHGKSTLTDLLIALSENAGTTENALREIETRPREDAEKERGLTVRATAISLQFEQSTERAPLGSDGNVFLVSLIDTPGHVDFSAEVIAALRVTDGAIFVVDCVEGVRLHAATMLRLALTERVKPVLLVNKLDRLLRELELDPETAYQILLRTIESANGITSTYEDELLGDVQVNPSLCTVAFGSGLQGWGFTLTRFADIYTKKFGVDRERMMTKLWGDNYFDPDTKTWSEKEISPTGATLKRGFVQYVLDPIFRLCKAVLDGEEEKVGKMLKGLDKTLTPKEKVLRGKGLLEVVMRKWLPMQDALLEVIVSHLPSPVVAQRYRVKSLYEGGMGHEAARAIHDCNSKGPLMLYISKMVPSTTDRGRFYAFGRVFSGTVRAGQSVHIMAVDNDADEKKSEIVRKSIGDVVLMMGKTVESIGDVPCGNIVALVGIDDVVRTSCTVTDSDTASPLRALKLPVNHDVVRAAVEPELLSEYPQVPNGLKILGKSDPTLHCYEDETEHRYIVAGVGELHIKMALEAFTKFSGIELRTAILFVSFRESVSACSSIILAKSENRCNAVCISAAPIGKLTEAIEDGTIDLHGDEKERNRVLVEEFGWDAQDTKKIWAIGGDNLGPNVIVDMTKDVTGVNGIKDAVLHGVNRALDEGVLCLERVRGIRVNLHDCLIYVDNGRPQIPSPTIRATRGAMFSAQPVLLEPIYLVDIVCPPSVVDLVYSLTRRRGTLISSEPLLGTSDMSIKAHVPLIELLAFTAHLRPQTSGQVLPQAVFHHWAALPDNAIDPGTKAHEVVMGVRKRRGLKATFPSIDEIVDKLVVL